MALVLLLLSLFLAVPPRGAGILKASISKNLAVCHPARPQPESPVYPRQTALPAWRQAGQLTAILSRDGHSRYQLQGRG
jgi:hypothetical protein